MEKKIAIPIWTVRVIREEIWKIETETEQGALAMAREGNDISFDPPPGLLDFNSSCRSVSILGKD